MILESFKIKFKGALTDGVKGVLKNKTQDFDFSRVANLCVKITASPNFLLHELNDITAEIKKSVNNKLEVYMQILVDPAYPNDLKNVEVITSNNRREWEKLPFLAFKGDAQCI